MHAVVSSMLFKTQLLHDARHIVQSSLALDYSVKVSFFIVPFFFCLKYSYRSLGFWVIRVFYALRKEAEF